MNPLKKFEEYLAEGMAKRCAIDRSRAEYLVSEARLSLEGLSEIMEKIGINDKNANSIIKECHDILLEITRAKMLLDGFCASGKGAHESEVAYFAKMGFNQNDVDFLNKLRYFRNGITYYGKIFSKEYAGQVFSFLKKIYPKLLSLSKRKEMEED